MSNALQTVCAWAARDAVEVAEVSRFWIAVQTRFEKEDVYNILYIII